MYVCVCRGVTDKQIQRELDNGAASLAEIQERLDVATCCGQCKDFTQELIDNSLSLAYAVAV